jgi:hypothetical protein
MYGRIRRRITQIDPGARAQLAPVGQVLVHAMAHLDHAIMASQR